MRKPIISIVVPVYKVENFEMLIVNDVTKDNSINIAKKYLEIWGINVILDGNNINCIYINIFD